MSTPVLTRSPHRTPTSPLDLCDSWFNDSLTSSGAAASQGAEGADTTPEGSLMMLPPNSVRGPLFPASSESSSRTLGQVATATHEISFSFIVCHTCTRQQVTVSVYENPNRSISQVNFPLTKSKNSQAYSGSIKVSSTFLTFDFDFENIGIPNQTHKVPVWPGHDIIWSIDRTPVDPDVVISADSPVRASRKKVKPQAFLSMSFTHRISKKQKTAIDLEHALKEDASKNDDDFVLPQPDFFGQFSDSKKAEVDSREKFFTKILKPQGILKGGLVDMEEVNSKTYLEINGILSSDFFPKELLPKDTVWAYKYSAKRV